MNTNGLPFAEYYAALCIQYYFLRETMAHYYTLEVIPPDSFTEYVSGFMRDFEIATAEFPKRAAAIVAMPNAEWTAVQS